LEPTTTTIQDRLNFLSPKLARSTTPPSWPPDAFGLTAALLLESGAYLSVVREWPLVGPVQDGFLECAPEEWSKKLEEIGKAWRRREAWQSPGGASLPKEIVHWWHVVRSNRHLPLAQISGNKSVFCALLQICAAADEASYSVGLGEERDAFGDEAESELLPDRRAGSTLCKQIDPSKLRVLPKGHTPQTGITLRSLSLYLALQTDFDVTPLWFTASLTEQAEPHSLSVLLIPWPTRVTPRQFVPAKPSGGRLLNMPEKKFGFFTYRGTPDPKALERLRGIYQAAVELTGHIDGVVLPELALDESEYDPIRDWVTAQQSFLITGVGASGEGLKAGKNRVAIEVPTGNVEAMGKGHRISAFQNKHHRWRLDRSQIVQYGLGGQLDPERHWWEHISAEARHLTFISLQSWLSVCALVCEDLARQEPVARLVRAVGPNLVIALLMDGPQLTSRWPARYATVLADDPGSSVLTFTSIGMCEFSRPAGKAASRTVALWKDSLSGETREIDLPVGAEGLVLNLVRRMDEEWTADGRSDGGNAGFPALAGVHPVFVR